MIHGSGANTSDDRRIGVVMRFLSPHVKKPNNAPDYGVPMRGNCDTGNFTLCDAPKGLFHPEDLLLYEEIRTEQAKVMMAGAEGNMRLNIPRALPIACSGHWLRWMKASLAIR